VTEAFLGSATANDEVIGGLVADLNRVRAEWGANGRPFVTLSYAQSVDGSIALEAGRPYTLSGPEALRLTHALRAAHDGILVGIGTVLADDPQLNVRLCDGPSPRPVVVDSRLRTPEDARLFAAPGRDGRAPWIATTNGVDHGHRSRLEARGARVLKVKALANGWVDLPSLCKQIREQGVDHLMVEGGARIITSFLRARLVDYVVITVSPRLLGGLAALRGLALDSVGEVASVAGDGATPRLTRWATHRLGDDLVLSGELRWSAE
jgi:3,4-dihydroxy 2-butanone 4-phosphate synthase/GTP cyclohydrolase II